MGQGAGAASVEYLVHSNMIRSPEISWIDFIDVPQAVSLPESDPDVGKYFLWLVQGGQSRRGQLLLSFVPPVTSNFFQTGVTHTVSHSALTQRHLLTFMAMHLLCFHMSLVVLSIWLYHVTLQQTVVQATWSCFPGNVSRDDQSVPYGGLRGLSKIFRRQT